MNKTRLPRVDITYLENDIPQTIMRRGFNQKGRPRIIPKELTNIKDLGKALNKRVKDFTELERKSYNRLASRIDYAKTRQQEISGQTSTQYKEKIGKKIKDMTTEQKRTYNRLAKQEERLIKKYKQ